MIGDATVMHLHRSYLAIPFAREVAEAVINRKSSFSDISFVLRLAENEEARPFSTALESLNGYFKLALSLGKDLNAAVGMLANRRVSDALCLSFALGTDAVQSYFKYDERITSVDMQAKSEILSYLQRNTRVDPQNKSKDRLELVRDNVRETRVYRNLVSSVYSIINWDDVIRIALVIDILLHLSNSGTSFILSGALQPFMSINERDYLVSRLNCRILDDLAVNAVRDSSFEPVSHASLVYMVNRETGLVVKKCFMNADFGNLQSRAFALLLDDNIIDRLISEISQNSEFITLPLHHSFHDEVLDVIELRLDGVMSALNFSPSERRGLVEGLASSILEVSSAHFDAGTKNIKRSRNETDARVPDKAPYEWPKDAQPNETPPEFIMRAYEESHGNGLTMAHVRGLNPALAQSLYYHVRKGRPMPEGFDLPTKPAKVSRDVQAYETTGRLALPDGVSDEHVLREYQRVRQAQWRRGKTEPSR